MHEKQAIYAEWEEKLEDLCILAILVTRKGWNSSNYTHSERMVPKKRAITAVGAILECGKLENSHRGFER